MYKFIKVCMMGFDHPTFWNSSVILKLRKNTHYRWQCKMSLMWKQVIDMKKSRFSTWCYLHWYVNKINRKFLRAHDSQGPHINLKSCWFKFFWIQDYWRLQWEICVFNCFIFKLLSDGFITEMHRCMSNCVQYVVQMFCNNCHFLSSSTLTPLWHQI